jgi:C-terminal processing protease CtpA/Prc
VGSTHNITWTSQGSVGTVRIELLNNSTLVQVIAYNYYNDGRPFAWTVPDIPTTYAKIRIKEYNTGNYADTSNSTFTIKRPTITVTSPNGGETFYVGSTHNITWTSQGSVGTVRIELLNNSTLVQVIAYNYYNDGRPFAWTVPDIPTTYAKIRIKEYNTGNYADTSNSTFTIKRQ